MEEEEEKERQADEEDNAEARDEEMMEDYDEEDYDLWSTRASFDRFSLSLSKVRPPPRPPTRPPGRRVRRVTNGQKGP